VLLVPYWAIGKSDLVTYEKIYILQAIMPETQGDFLKECVFTIAGKDHKLAKHTQVARD